MARPKKHKADLTKVVSFRLTEEEYISYATKFTTSGLNSSEFFRTCVLENKTQIIAKPILSQEQKRMAFLFNKVGNHINHLAQAANTAFLADKVNESTFKAILNNLEDLSHYFKRMRAAQPPLRTNRKQLVT